MEQSVENLRVEFLRILEEIEKISKGDETRNYEPSKYESCIKIDGKPILPPLMTKGKRIYIKDLQLVSKSVKDVVRCHSTYY